MPHFHLSRWMEGGRRVLRLLGTLDGDAANALMREIRRESELDLAVDVALVRGFDEVGVAALARLAQRSDGRIVLRGLSHHQLRILRYLGVGLSGALRP